MQMNPATPIHTDYAEYLHLEMLLAAQHPLSDHPDELHFIIIHQVHELWFKLALHHLARARDAMLASDPREAVRLITQVNAVFVNLRQTVEHLHSLPPASFHVFRHLLAPGSGMQSYQFREIELLAGRRDDRFLKWVRNTLGDPIHWEQIKERLDEPSIAEAFEGLLTAHQVADVATLYQRTAEFSDLYAAADGLSTLDQILVAWRHSHVQLIERTIGATTTGTGGTTHDYLQAMLQVRLFPALWEARNELSRRTDEAYHQQGQAGS
jgi:tryptophan 2,3-dioxygenase